MTEWAVMSLLVVMNRWLLRRMMATAWEFNPNLSAVGHWGSSTVNDKVDAVVAVVGVSMIGLCIQLETKQDRP